MAEESSSRKRKRGDEAAGGDNWSKLPDVPLQKIFSFLNRPNHFKMARMCVTWKKGLEFPGVLDFFVFGIGNRLSQLSIDETCFAKNYGHRFRTLLVESLPIKDLHLITSRLERLKIFMEILAPKSELTAIYFRKICFCLRLLPIPKYNKMCKAIAEFLGSQSQLKQLQMIMCLFKYSDGIRILKRAIESNEGINDLTLTGFLEYKDIDPDDSADEQILSEILKLPDLGKVVCDYRLILGERANPSQVIESLKNRRKSLIMELRLLISADSRRYAILTSEQWKSLRNANTIPQLKVKIQTFSEFQAETAMLIVADMPVTHFEYIFNIKSEYTIKNSLDFLETWNIPDNLEFFGLSFWEEMVNLDSIFTTFLEKCKKLEAFKFTVVHTVTGLEMFLNSLSERKPESLKKVIFDIEFLQDQIEKQRLTYLFFEHKPLLESVNIALEITT